MIEEYFCRTCGVDWKTMNEKNINEFTDNLVFLLYVCDGDQQEKWISDSESSRCRH